MFSIHGKAIQGLNAYRVVSGCPWIMGSRLRPVAKNHRDFAAELDR
jgi:hypothetical protein